MRVLAGVALLVLGGAAFAASQRTRRSDPKIVSEPNYESDPVWSLPIKGRWIAVVGMLLFAGGLALLTS